MGRLPSTALHYVRVQEKTSYSACFHCSNYRRFNTLKGEIEIFIQLICTITYYLTVPCLFILLYVSFALSQLMEQLNYLAQLIYPQSANLILVSVFI